MRSITYILALLFIAILAACGLHKTEKSTEPGEKRFIVGYVFPGDRVMDESEVNGALLTHINFAFANIIDGKMVEGYPTDSINFAVLRKVREQHPHLKLLISVGGWGWSGNFSDMAMTAKNRAIFIQSAVDFLKKHELDGLDLDWEYPGLPGNNNIHRPEDKENFTALLSECRQALDELGGNKKHYLLTIAAAAFSGYLEHTEMDVAADYLDFINIMTYDFTGEWDNSTGHHTNLHRPAFDANAMSVEGSVDLFIETGVPAEKLLIGVAFYGRGWREVSLENNGLGQPAIGLSGTNLNYNSIVRDFLSDPAFRPLRDTSAAAPFLWNPEGRIFITFEDPESLKRKAEFVNDKGLKGIMFWQYFGDHEETLLRVIFEEINR
ncbi:MAG: glycoside hydrolase family 18 protein [Bacteroides sp.]|nr:glycoside hydrolase family 18 protein [Bacteroides sp.]